MRDTDIDRHHMWAAAGQHRSSPLLWGGSEGGAGGGLGGRPKESSLGAQLVKNHLQCRRPEFDPWVAKNPGEEKGYPLQYSGLEYSMHW